MKPDLFNLSLRAGFPNWDSIERGQVLARCRRDGLSNRTLAGVLNISEGSVRNHLLLLKLSPADQAAIKAGAAMRPFLVRLRGVEAPKGRIGRQSACEQASASANATCEIQSWFRERGIAAALAERILLDTQALIRLGEQQGAVKPSDSAWGGAPAQISAAARKISIGCTA